jgi:formylglycine-generating enzyme required for sulfatase activity
VPAGKFVMGSKYDNELASDNEKPQHTVDINYDYWMAKFILTNERYAEYLGKKKHPVADWQKKKDHPVVSVSWNDAMEYCAWFNETFKSGLGDLLLRLPTEAEWEKAARGAYGNEWPWGNEFDANKCNSVEGKRGDTTSVGIYTLLGGDSPYGCSDMAGNVWEWCNDFYMVDYYSTSPLTDPKGPDAGQTKVVRGGAWRFSAQRCRSGYRYNENPGYADVCFGYDIYGFRCVRKAPGGSK